MTRDQLTNNVAKELNISNTEANTTVLTVLDVIKQGIIIDGRGRESIEFDDDEPDEEGVLNPRTEELDDDEMGIN